MSSNCSNPSIRMTPRARRPGPRSKRNTAVKARQYLSGGGVSREDSDDELGIEDYPWEWVYADAVPSWDDAAQSMSTAAGTSAPNEDSDAFPSRSGVAHRRDGRSEGQIIGARMGSFECKVGDCVLLKAEGTNEAWVGLICEFREEEGDEGKVANFMWFSSEKEIRNREKKRTDFMQVTITLVLVIGRTTLIMSRKNELYLTPSWDLNPLASINGKAWILSPKTFLTRFPTGKVPRSSKESGKIFICRRGCNTRTATYTDEFVWDDIYKGSQQDLDALIGRIQRETKATRKRRRRESAQESETLDVRFSYLLS